ncbi:hypothetical protein Hamer_G003690 [Homarus americanus]|uniref:Uncharacterized protein n=1 Tax=Homarus americanus TaxID=6706 RepID=A0A8J5MUV6_HOMAM|nr:hypothetical protein Hamer_G003690 [Homarus americanus]
MQVDVCVVAGLCVSTTASPLGQLGVMAALSAAVPRVLHKSWGQEAAPHNTRTMGTTASSEVEKWVWPVSEESPGEGSPHRKSESRSLFTSIIAPFVGGRQRPRGGHRGREKGKPVVWRHAYTRNPPRAPPPPPAIYHPSGVSPHLIQANLRHPPYSDYPADLETPEYVGDANSISTVNVDVSEFSEPRPEDVVYISFEDGDDGSSFQHNSGNFIQVSLANQPTSSLSTSFQPPPELYGDENAASPYSSSESVEINDFMSPPPIKDLFHTVDVTGKFSQSVEPNLDNSIEIQKENEFFITGDLPKFINNNGGHISTTLEHHHHQQHQHQQHTDLTQQQPSQPPQQPNSFTTTHLQHNTQTISSSSLSQPNQQPQQLPLLSLDNNQQSLSSGHEQQSLASPSPEHTQQSLTSPTLSPDLTMESHSAPSLSPEFTGESPSSGHDQQSPSSPLPLSTHEQQTPSSQSKPSQDNQQMSSPSTSSLQDQNLSSARPQRTPPPQPSTTTTASKTKSATKIKTSVPSQITQTIQKYEAASSQLSKTKSHGSTEAPPAKRQILSTHQPLSAEIGVEIPLSQDLNQVSDSSFDTQSKLSPFQTKLTGDAFEPLPGFSEEEIGPSGGTTIGFLPFDGSDEFFSHIFKGKNPFGEKVVTEASNTRVATPTPLQRPDVRRPSFAGGPTGPTPRPTSFQTLLYSDSISATLRPAFRTSSSSAIFHQPLAASSSATSSSEAVSQASTSNFPVDITKTPPIEGPWNPLPESLYLFSYFLNISPTPGTRTFVCQVNTAGPFAVTEVDENPSPLHHFTQPVGIAGQKSRENPAGSGDFADYDVLVLPYTTVDTQQKRETSAIAPRNPEKAPVFGLPITRRSGHDHSTLHYSSDTGQDAFQFGGFPGPADDTTSHRNDPRQTGHDLRRSPVSFGDKKSTEGRELPLDHGDPNHTLPTTLRRDQGVAGAGSHSEGRGSQEASTETQGREVFFSSGEQVEDFMQVLGSLAPPPSSFCLHGFCQDHTPDDDK